MSHQNNSIILSENCINYFIPSLYKSLIIQNYKDQQSKYKYYIIIHFLI